ncbi:MAG: helix-turn-helix domain-containing protein [Phycisphaerales bacterium]|nr:helix-turn-helix domain-containing protein [Phycisphaerales bacterium]
MTEKRTETTPEMLEVKNVAALLGCSPRHVNRMSRTGRIPRPLKLGTLVRWRRSELLAWIDDGCPTLRDRKAVTR